MGNMAAVPWYNSSRVRNRRVTCSAKVLFDENMPEF